MEDKRGGRMRRIMDKNGRQGKGREKRIEKGRVTETDETGRTKEKSEEGRW